MFRRGGKTYEEEEEEEKSERTESTSGVFKMLYTYTCMYKHVTRIYTRVTRTMRFSATYIHTHTHTHIDIIQSRSILHSKFLFFSLEQFFLIEFKNTHGYIHTHTRTYSPSDGDAFLFCTWKAFFRYLISCRKESKMKRWKRKIYYIRREQRRARGINNEREIK